ncbi:MAG: 50S ribosomal protein L3 N(5)-glutamine methyltransferase [Pseudomonadales bacterium]|nr:50S ribosomal protein L3 N(5)-glutamine methyltransferase [Pseudomonadales bacterium]
MTTYCIKQCLEIFTSRFDQSGLFYGHGTDNPGDEAFYLVFGALGLDYQAYEDLLDRRVSSLEYDRLEKLAEQRIRARIPLAYLLGEAWFAGLPFIVNSDVLIPRSPLAELILDRFSGLLRTRPQKILDLCTGSGCIGIACAVQFPESQVVLSDISTAALDIARQNIRRHELTARVNCCESDLFEEISGHYDLIISNPPYVSAEEVVQLPEEYQKEPVLGLLSADNGLAIPLQILRLAANYLSPQGVLIMEVGYSQESLQERLPEVPFLWLDFAEGGEGVLLLSRQQLIDYNKYFLTS